jgi:pyruvate formate lyase activating enzyme
MASTAETTLFGELLLRHTRPGELSRDLGGGVLECFACAHRCRIKEGSDGICRVRFHRGGRLLVPWGYVSSLALDPVEKKPFFHALPGSTALSFGMLGCDYHCGYCQNWVTSQALRDPAAESPIEEIEPADIAAAAVAEGAAIVTSTYNEPLITSEWAVAVFREARLRGLRTAYVSNGNATAEVLAYLRPWIDFYKVDLKGFDAKQYRQLGGRLEPVLETIRELHALGVWVEVVTLVVPGWNDGAEELRAAARFLASVSADIPWHVTAFHPDYRMRDPGRTGAAALMRAASIGTEEGLRFVYAGNLPGAVGRFEHTSCPGCRTVLVERSGFRIVRNLLRDGRCPSCRADVPGVWS